MKSLLNMKQLLKLRKYLKINQSVWKLFLKITSTEYVYNHKNDQVSIIDLLKKT
jgi:hypothetical protein